MICDHLHASARYAGFGSGFAAAFQYLRRASLGDFSLGRTEIIPDRVWATIVQKPGRAADAAGFEYHAEFADLHLCLAGRERMGWRENAHGLVLRTPFNAEKDFGLYAGTPDEFLALSGDRFAIFFPGELHAPLIAEDELTKICVKVRCDPLS
jgi:YhcH/YjgK/YiaL family protein